MLSLLYLCHGKYCQNIGVAMESKQIQEYKFNEAWKGPVWYNCQRAFFLAQYNGVNDSEETHWMETFLQPFHFLQTKHCRQTNRESLLKWDCRLVSFSINFPSTSFGRSDGPQKTCLSPFLLLQSPRRRRNSSWAGTDRTTRLFRWRRT